MWVEGGEENEEFEEDQAEGVITLEWQDLANPTNASIWYKEERIAKPIKEDDLWYRDDINEENDLWAQEEIDHFTWLGRHY